MSDDEKKMKLIDSALSVLSEHFDCVQITASELKPNGGTKAYHRGTGNWYARRALCQEFIERDQANTFHDVGNQNTPPPEGDEWKKQP